MSSFLLRPLVWRDCVPLRKRLSTPTPSAVFAPVSPRSLRVHRNLMLENDNTLRTANFWHAAFALEQALACVSERLQVVRAELDTGAPADATDLATSNQARKPVTSTAESPLDDKLTALEHSIDVILSHASTGMYTPDDCNAFQTRATVARACDMSLALPALLSSVHSMEPNAGTISALVAPSDPPSRVHQHALGADSGANPASLFTTAVHMSSALDKFEQYVDILEQRVLHIREAVNKDTACD